MSAALFEVLYLRRRCEERTHECAPSLKRNRFPKTDHVIREHSHCTAAHLQLCDSAGVVISIMLTRRKYEGFAEPHTSPLLVGLVFAAAGIAIAALLATFALWSATRFI